MNLEGTSLIGFGRAPATGTPTPAVDPATGERLDPPYHWAGPGEVDRAVNLAADAFRVYARTARTARAAFLRTIAALLEADTEAIVARATRETALPPARIKAETGRTCGQLRLFASLAEDGSWVDARIDHADLARQPVPKPDVRSMLRPLGPVAVFSASNFPMAFSVVGGDTASALAAGCPVVVKAHQGHLGTSEMVGLIVRRAVQECGLPEGTFSVLFGPGTQVGTALVKHPLIQAVGFTGSRSGGRALMDVAAARPEPIPVYAEMGSINPVFLLPQALKQRVDQIAIGLHGSVTLGVGQFCTNPGLVFVDAGDAAGQFLAKFAALMNATPAGTMLTEGICAAFRDGVERFAGIPGVKRVVHVTAEPGPGKANAGPALFVTDAQTFLHDHRLMEELFGPATLVVHCRTRDEMANAAKVIEGQLTATVHGTDEEIAANADLLTVLERKVGRIVCNGFPTGVEVCHAMHHGGPYPATSDGRSTSVGTRAALRFVKPVCYQNYPDAALPEELREANPLGIARLVDGKRIESR